MVIVVTIKKDGSFKNEHTKELYKCCKYKSEKDFVKIYQWDDYELWGKLKGKAGNENKCELPELNDNTIKGNDTAIGSRCNNNKDVIKM